VPELRDVAARFVEFEQALQIAALPLLENPGIRHNEPAITQEQDGTGKE
jgi:hypothetical protein